MLMIYLVNTILAHASACYDFAGNCSGSSSLREVKYDSLLFLYIVD